MASSAVFSQQGSLPGIGIEGSFTYVKKVFLEACWRQGRDADVIVVPSARVRLVIRLRAAITSSKRSVTTSRTASTGALTRLTELALTRDPVEEEPLLSVDVHEKRNHFSTLLHSHYRAHFDVRRVEARERSAVWRVNVTLRVLAGSRLTSRLHLPALKVERRYIIHLEKEKRENEVQKVQLHKDLRTCSII